MFQYLRIDIPAFMSKTEFYSLFLYIDMYYPLVAFLVEIQLFFAPRNILKCHLWHTCELLLHTYLHSNNSDMLNTLLLNHVLKESNSTGFTLK